MKARTRSTVSVVTRPPRRRRLTSLPSFTARRPKVDSAMRALRQKSAISRRSTSLKHHLPKQSCREVSNAYDTASTINMPTLEVGGKVGRCHSISLVDQFGGACELGQ